MFTQSYAVLYLYLEQLVVVPGTRTVVEYTRRRRIASSSRIPSALGPADLGRPKSLCSLFIVHLSIEDSIAEVVPVAQSLCNLFLSAGW